MIAISSIRTEQNSIKNKWEFTSSEKILNPGRDCNLLDPHCPPFLSSSLPAPCFSLVTNSRSRAAGRAHGAEDGNGIGVRCCRNWDGTPWEVTARWRGWIDNGTGAGTGEVAQEKKGSILIEKTLTTSDGLDRLARHRFTSYPNLACE